jgi:hypothetical protein
MLLMLKVLLLAHLAVSEAQSTQSEWQDDAPDTAKCGEGDGVCLLQSRRFLERIDDAPTPPEGFAEEVAEDKKEAEEEEAQRLDLRMAAELALLGEERAGHEDCMGKDEEEDPADGSQVKFTVFSTGRPRNRYGHKNSETYACCDGEHVALDVDLSSFKSPRTEGAKACAEAAIVPSKRAPAGFSHIMINEDGECIVSLKPGCSRTKYNTAMYNDYRSDKCLFTTTYAVSKKGMPMVSGVFPNSGTPLGGTRVTITGVNLWSALGGPRRRALATGSSIHAPRRGRAQRQV